MNHIHKGCAVQLYVSWNMALWLESFNIKPHIAWGKENNISAASEKYFSYYSCLKKHKRTHTWEKPYQCSQCDKTFTTKQSLKMHLRIHTGEKPYQCSQYDKTFSREASAYKHSDPWERWPIPPRLTFTHHPTVLLARYQDGRTYTARLLAFYRLYWPVNSDTISHLEMPLIYLKLNNHGKFVFVHKLLPDKLCEYRLHSASSQGTRVG